MKEGIATNKSSKTLQHVDIYGFFSFLLQLHFLLVKLALNSSTHWPQDSPANIKDLLSVPGVGWLMLCVCEREKVSEREMQMFMYMNRFRDPQETYKTKTGEQYKLI